MLDLPGAQALSFLLNSERELAMQKKASFFNKIPEKNEKVAEAEAACAVEKVGYLLTGFRVFPG